jgi:putative membrane protein
MSTPKFIIDKKLIIVSILSISIPLITAILFLVKLDLELPFSPHLLPAINAVLNTITAFLLFGALFAVKKKQYILHSSLIYAAMFFSLSFIVIYVFYHMVTDTTVYGGNLGIIYYPLLFSHIIFASIITPLVLFAYLYALRGQLDKHKKLVKFSYPIWLYVAISGVLCYIMISPYYGIDSAVRSKPDFTYGFIISSALFLPILFLLQKRYFDAKLKSEENEKVLKDAREKLEKNNNLLESLKALQSEFFLGDNLKLSFDKMLRYLLDITQSEYGFMGEVLHDEEGNPYLKSHTLTKYFLE